jgi:predicted outer membrane protein
MKGLSACVPALFLCAAALAQQQPSDSTARPHSGQPDAGLTEPGEASSSRGNTSDGAHRRIVHRLHRANLLAIEAGRLAQQNGTEPVRELGRKLVDEHTKADAALLDAAVRLGILIGPHGRTQISTSTPGSAHGATTGSGGDQPDPRASDPHRAKLAELRELQGGEFDRRFLELVVSDHQKALDGLRAAQLRLQPGDPLATLLDEQLPAMEEHLEAAQQLLRKGQAQPPPKPALGQ